eukprot:SAG31_NODE_33366_length_344_cov_1.228571_2_plen_51_part_01
MMVALQLDKRVEFDALFAFAKAYMQHLTQSDGRYGYFAWHVSPTGSQMDAN